MMKPRLNFRRFAVLTLVSALAVLPATSANASDDLIAVSPEEIDVSMPAPGESVDWEVTISNLSQERLPLHAELEGWSDTLFDGEHPLTLHSENASTGEVYMSGAVPSLLGTGFDPGELPPHEVIRISGVVGLPQAAGNEYQGGAATLRLTVTTMLDQPADPGDSGDEGEDPGDLADTGSSALLFAMFLMMVLVTAAVGLLLRRRRGIRHGA